jgi:hypothetical protein
MISTTTNSTVVLYSTVLYVVLYSVETTVISMTCDTRADTKDGDVTTIELQPFIILPKK